VLDWSEPDREPHRAILDWYAALVRLRTAEPDLTDDDLDRVDVDYTDDWFVLRRGTITVAANLSTHPVNLPLTGTPLLTFGTVDGSTLGAHTTTILRTAH
jgi:maltooligosyltrehalose trehalohydrolase